jgi:hypothetical protein
MTREYEAGQPVRMHTRAYGFRGKIEWRKILHAEFSREYRAAVTFVKYDVLCSCCTGKKSDTL